MGIGLHSLKIKETFTKTIRIQ